MSDLEELGDAFDVTQWPTTVPDKGARCPASRQLLPFTSTLTTQLHIRNRHHGSSWRARLRIHAF